MAYISNGNRLCIETKKLASGVKTMFFLFWNETYTIKGITPVFLD